MTQGVRAGIKDLRKIQRKFKKGYHLASSGSGHYVVMGPDGEPVRRNDGSGRHLGLPSSPKPSSVSYHIERLRAHGVLVETGQTTREHGRLVRDDLLPGNADQHERNNVATRQLLEDLQQVKIYKPRTLTEYAELTDILATVSGTDTSLCNNSLMRLYNGMILTEQDQAPFAQLIMALETEEDPIKTRFNLLRKARGIPTEEPEQVAEVTFVKGTLKEETTVETRFDTTTVLNVPGVQGIVANFISDLKEKVTEMNDEIDKINDLIGQLEDSYPSIKIEADEDTPHPAKEQNGGTHRPRSTPAGRTQEGRRVPKVITTDMVMEVLDRGGEWTMVEIADTFDAAVPQISKRLKELVESGSAVVVTPTGYGARGKTPATYGSKQFFNTV